jgi:hypothetical protein
MKSRESKGEGDIGGAQVKGMLILEEGRLTGVAWVQMLAMAVVAGRAVVMVMGLVTVIYTKSAFCLSCEIGDANEELHRRMYWTAPGHWPLFGATRMTSRRRKSQKDRMMPIMGPHCRGSF